MQTGWLRRSRFADYINRTVFKEIGVIKWRKISVTSSRENTLKPFEPLSFPKLHYLFSYLMKNFFCRKLYDTMEGIIIFVTTQEVNFRLKQEMNEIYKNSRNCLSKIKFFTKSFAKFIFFTNYTKFNC